ncbi:hypothetical protein HZM52_002306 [Salmonella enterica]|nr:hypothetical protein [Salmonella enterica subsp. enterica serovar Montevideo]EFR2111656.1 hypothetical protein [Salmonella enterica]EFR2359730.1 hypothetical protein [Salmonella enterica]ELH6183263.1 hypothetical protein [Salmonella enterica]
MQVTGEQPTQQGLEGNPARMWLNRRVSAFVCDELARAGVDSIAQTCARLRGAEALFLKGDSGKAWPLMC